jgi:hypothetical protein
MTDRPPLDADWFDQVTLLPCLRDRLSRTGYTFGAFGRNGESIPAFAHPWCEVRQPDCFAPRKLVPLHSDFDSLSPGGPCGSDGPPCFAIRR